jgi:hypothetical protein
MSNINVNLESELKTIVNKFRETQFVAIQESLEETGKDMVGVLQRATPSSKNTGLFKNSWKYKLYAGEVYSYNERGANGVGRKSGIPISNVSEYTRKGFKPFIKSSFEANSSRIFDRFKKRFENKISRRTKI